MQRRWLITGASRGLGLALADAVAARGDTVIAAARDVHRLEDLARRHIGRIEPLQLDVSDRDSFGDLTSRTGAIDVLVNNAGYGYMTAVEDASDADIRAQFEVNFFGAVALTKAYLPTMRRRGSGWIVNVTSAAGVVSGPAAAFYSGSKFALEGFSEALAAEVASLGIGVTIVEPGALRTDFAGPSLRWSEDHGGANEAVAKTRAYLSESDGAQMGDPAKAADLIVDAIGNFQAPLRLILGPDCQQLIEKRMLHRLEEAQSQKDSAASIVYEDQPRDFITPFD